MTCFGKRASLKCLGTLHGSGSLSIHDGKHLGSVGYEIDGYADRTIRSADGQVEGKSSVLAQAFRAGAARIVLNGGSSVDIVLSDPQGGQTAEIKVSGRFPL